ncbi:MAG: DUF3084 domain-containing protein [Kastovskya adunca ATA6-11-RM4]|jgi:uncharacterized protein (DUF3084 family)|nr:DUF3084 domain-containing protein [Kastovskya adunca ATA6-11-RM4]
MTSGYILIAAILVLGGLLATLGDRLGTRVGKARLSLFNLRPRNTAVVVTIVTGSLISASTLGILFATSKSLRQGIFELDEIQKRLRIARSDLTTVNTQKQQIEQELAEARAEQLEAQRRLNTINESLKEARAEQAQTAAQLQRTERQLTNVSEQRAALRSEIEALLEERKELIRQRDQVRAEIAQLNAENQQLKGQNEQLKGQNEQLKDLVAQRDQEIAKRNQTITERNQVIAQREARLRELEQEFEVAIAQREARLQELEEFLLQQETLLAQQNNQLDTLNKQQTYLQQEVKVLEQYFQNYQVLRQGNVAIVRGRVLASGVVRITDPAAARSAVDQLLREANRTTAQITRTGTDTGNDQIVQITQAQVEQLVEQINDGRDYVVRIISAANYVEGERPIQVFADAAVNQVVFQPGDVLAAISADSSTMSDREVRTRLDQLLAASEFRARRAGILGEIQIEDGRVATMINFIDQLNQYDKPVDVKAVAVEPTATAGPLKVRLVVIQDGQVIFST